jgi:hypothetical protein
MPWSDWVTLPARFEQAVKDISKWREEKAKSDGLNEHE